METGLSWLLRAAWIAGTLPILIASIPSSRISSLHKLVLEFAKRGKIKPSASPKFTVPQRFFLHFYLLGVAWTTALLLATWQYAYEVAPMGSESLHHLRVATHLTGGSHVFSLHKSSSATPESRYRVWLSVFLLLLMELHVLRRLYETVYVFKYGNSARMHICGYLTGLFFYTAAPLSLVSCCALEVVNYVIDRIAEFKIQGQDMVASEFNLWSSVKPITKLGWSQWAGAVIFFWGWVHQYRCHAILGGLRKKRKHINEYVIPHGDWFEFVSSPHYLAEMVIYLGLLVASGGTDLTIWLLFGFVVANLAFAAAETQRWYHDNFEDYPSKRRAIFPFIC